MTQNQYAPPVAHVEDQEPDARSPVYAGFWIRVVASLLDTVLIMICTYPLLIAIYGMAYLDLEKASFVQGPAEVLISWIAPAVVIIALWLTKQATPGKMAVAVKVVDARTGGKLSIGQSIGRYAAYFLSLVPLGLGIIWVGFDAKKQGWHDKLAGTLVVKSRR